MPFVLDQSILTQLRQVFGKLEASIELVYAPSSHGKQQELVDLLIAVADTSPNISVQKSETQSEVPHFSVVHDGKATGVSFTGIPGGHEFTSLVLAILNSDGKGKLPDEILLDRIRRVQGPIRLRTFVSLSCENCPDVVQALNLMAIVHDDFHNEMIDGAFAEDEIQRLSIQGVPSVISGDHLVSSGKTSLTELIDKLEQHFGSIAITNTKAKDLGAYDVAVIGGGPAGAAAAIYTARKGLKTTVISDRLGGQLQDTKGIENLISVSYTEGPKLTANLHEHLAQYDIDILEHRRVATVGTKKEKNDNISLALDSGENLQTKSVIVATGAKWRELGIDGEKKYLGRGVAFCPHCDGPYYKGKDIAVIGGGNSGVEAAIDLAGIVNSVTLFEFMPELKADLVLTDKLRALPNVSIVTNARTTQIIGDEKKVTALEYEDRQTETTKQIPLAGVFVQIGLIPNSKFINDLVHTNKYGEILIDEKCRTNVPGIYAAGDVTTVPYKQIVVAIGEGAKAGLAASEDQMIA